METIGEKLKRARKEQSLSQEEVSKILLISRQSISKWENDACMPDLDNLKRVCDLYNITPNDLLIDDEENLITSTINIKGSLYKNITNGYFLIPFFFIVIILRKEYRHQINKENVLFLVLNITFSLFLLVYIYAAIPKMTINHSI